MMLRLADGEGRPLIPEDATIEEAVHIALGAAAGCWERVDGEDLFLSGRFVAIREDLVEWLTVKRTPGGDPE